jgi:Zn-dependent peptidase ImmA (M78 family)
MTESLKSRAVVPLKVRPMLVSGMLATDGQGPVILINSEQEEREQVIALWHETLHLLGLPEGDLVETAARQLADAFPSVLRALAHNINAPNDGAKSRVERVGETITDQDIIAAYHAVMANVRQVSSLLQQQTPAPTEAEIHDTLTLFRAELNKNMELSSRSASPGHDAMRVALHELFAKRRRG